MRLPDRALLIAFISGLLLALSFPRPALASFAWFALIPVFAIMQRRPFACGFMAGVAFFGMVLYWLNIVMTTYGQMHPFFSAAAYIFLVCYLALFFGVATWAAVRLQDKLQLSIALTLPILWVALEFVRSFLLSGFPWALLGYSQANHPLVIQSADLVGVYGLTFLIVLVNAVLAEAVRSLRRRPFAPLPRKAIAVAIILVIANLAYGAFRLSEDLDSRDRSLQVALIQGNIDQGIKWDPALKQRTVNIYRDLTLEARARGELDLVVWPESATPFYFQDFSFLRSEVTDVPLRTGAFLLFGSPAYQQKEGGYENLNSAYLLDKHGRQLGRSDKVHLVPFGEYVPFGRLLPFIDKLVVGIGDFAPGLVHPLPMNGAKAGVLICFEGIFPELARDYVRRGSDILVNITNDAWFGRSSAPYQHLGMTLFRAVENRVWVARAANTGISAIISPAGRIVAQTPLFEEAALTGNLGLGVNRTFYTRFGDFLPIFFLLISLFWLVRAWKWPQPETAGH
ncbi:MAG: apolipoprotein N-acyltransferase [Desulfuromonadales bacterium]